VSGVVCGDATIVPDYKKRTRGVAIARSGPLDVSTDWDERGKLRLPEPATRVGIMISMAGKAAELIRFGSHVGGDHDDELKIALKREEDRIPNKQINYLRRKTRTMLLRHWPKVDHVAKALLAARTLTGEQIDALVAEKTTPREREIARHIEATRKPDRDRYLTMKAYVGGL
jgi:hypothetical protein